MLEGISNTTITNIIAFLAFLLGLYNWYELRVTLDVEISPNLEALSPKKVIFSGVDTSIECSVIFSGWIKVANPSSKDLAFFDLRAFNPNTNENYGLVTKKTFPPEMTESIIQVQGGSYSVNQDVPFRSFGSFKARSFTHFDIIIYPMPHQSLGKEIVLCFKTSKRTLFRKAPFAISRKKI